MFQVKHLRRAFLAAHRRTRELQMIGKGLASTDHPILAHVIPMRRCNLACAYCNEFDDSSKPVSVDAMYPRLDHLASLGTTNALVFSVLAVLAVMAFVPKPQKEYVARSHFAPYAAQAACTVAEVVPDEMKFRVKQSYQELAHVLPAKFRKALRPTAHSGI